MKEFLDGVLNVVKTINAYSSDYILVILLIAVGLYFTIRTRFVQVRCFGEGLKKVFGGFSFHGKGQKSGISSFQALATAAAAQVGTGNIIGASAAILVGGPGAIFWMWVIAFFGMATMYSEAVLSQKTRKVEADGTVLGGPVYYIKTAFKGKFGKILAGFFAVSCILALGFMGSMVQSNSIGETSNNAFKIPAWVIGIIVAVLSAVIFIGGIKRIASVTEKLVPFMAILYIVLCLIVICAKITYLPEAFGMIFKYAFNPQAILGGGFGMALKAAISQGAKRGLFSNEAGMGSTPHAHALANVKSPHDQGVVAMMGVFIDTFIVLSITATTIIITLYAGGGILADGSEVDVDKSNMAQLAFGTVFGNTAGGILVAICLFFFAFSTIIGWNLFGKVNFTYLFGKRSAIIYSILSIIFIFLGSCLSNELVWELTDLFNYIMVIPNVIAMIALTKLVVDEVKSARVRKKQEAINKLEDGKN